MSLLRQCQDRIRVFSLDISPDLPSTVTGDLRDYSYAQLRELGWPKPDLILFSPPCTTFSIASCGTHWYAPNQYGVRTPKTDKCRDMIEVVKSGLDIISTAYEINHRLNWIMENPRGILRKILHTPTLRIPDNLYNDLEHITEWYCMWKDEDRRAKPTDLWGFFPSFNDKFRPRGECRNYRYDADGQIIGTSPCGNYHASARRGAKTGTQGVHARNGISTNAARSLIPRQLSEAVFEAAMWEHAHICALGRHDKRLIVWDLCSGAHGWTSALYPIE